MRSTTLSIVAATLLAAGCLVAQPPMGRRHDDKTWAERRTDFLATRLTLSDSQKQQALSLYTAADQNSEPLESKLAQARRSLREATRRNAPYTEIDQLATTVGFLFGQLEAVQAKADTAVYNLLTAEQRQKMDRGRGGPGGFGRQRFPGPR